MSEYKINRQRQKRSERSRTFLSLGYGIAVTAFSDIGFAHMFHTNNLVSLMPSLILGTSAFTTMNGLSMSKETIVDSYKAYDKKHPEPIHPFSTSVVVGAQTLFGLASGFMVKQGWEAMQFNNEIVIDASAATVAALPIIDMIRLYRIDKKNQ